MRNLMTVAVVMLLTTIAVPASAATLQDLVATTFKNRPYAEIKASVAKLPKDQQALVFSSLKIDKRVIGGNAVDIKDYPWQVALIRAYAPEPTRSQFCGGTIIASDVVITAAHCVDNNIVRKDAARLDIIAGTAFYGAGGERIHVQGVFVHPQWNASNNDYDFALIKLATTVTMGKPVDLLSSDPPVGSFAEVSGWGSLSEGGSGSVDLLAAELPVVSTDVCNQKESYNSEITPQMLCAGEREGGVDSCQGDSGGPLVTKDGHHLVGVVSFGEGCARALKYGVYGRISAVIPWIKSSGQPGILIADALTPNGREIVAAAGPLAASVTP